MFPVVMIAFELSRRLADVVTEWSQEGATLRRIVMDWKRRRTWRPVVHDALVERVGGDYPARLAAASDAIEAADDERAVFTALRDRISRGDLIAHVERRWTERVSRVIAYHACRTNDAQTYFRSGVHLFRSDAAQANAQLLLASYPFDVSLEDLAVAITGVDTTLDEGKVFLSIDPRGFIEERGHYLIHGSEYIQNLIATLPRARWKKLRACLRARGRATILSCEIPREWVTEPTELAISMIVDHAWSVAKGRRSPHRLDHTVALPHAIPPDMVVGACHPTRIRDPHCGYRTWNEDLRDYEL